MKSIFHFNFVYHVILLNDRRTQKCAFLVLNILMTKNRLARPRILLINMSGFIFEA